MSLNLPEKIKDEDIHPLRDQEKQLIYLIRNEWRFGNVEIIVRDGLPVDVIRTVERKRL